MYLVPVTTNRRRLVRVEADDEWSAQSKAATTVNVRITPRSPYAELVAIDHAIPMEERVCGWGCCRK